MKRRKAFIAVVASAFATLAYATVLSMASAQAPGSPEELKGKRPPPAGTARDNSAPAEGAIKGGSLEPDIRTSPAPRRDIERCKELIGKLREECLSDLADEARKHEPAPPRQRRAEGN